MNVVDALLVPRVPGGQGGHREATGRKDGDHIGGVVLELTTQVALTHGRDVIGAIGKGEPKAGEAEQDRGSHHISVLYRMFWDELLCALLSCD